jgi:hypothetical protein
MPRLTTQNDVATVISARRPARDETWTAMQRGKFMMLRDKKPMTSKPAASAPGGLGSAHRHHGSVAKGLGRRMRRSLALFIFGHLG